MVYGTYDPLPRSIERDFPRYWRVSSRRMGMYVGTMTGIAFLSLGWMFPIALVYGASGMSFYIAGWAVATFCAIQIDRIAGRKRR